MNLSMNAILLTSCLFIICSPIHHLSHAIPTTNIQPQQPQQHAHQQQTQNEDKDQTQSPKASSQSAAQSVTASKHQELKSLSPDPTSPSVSSQRNKRESRSFLVNDAVPGDLLVHRPSYGTPLEGDISLLVSPRTERNYFVADDDGDEEEEEEEEDADEDDIANVIDGDVKSNNQSINYNDVSDDELERWLRTVLLAQEGNSLSGSGVDGEHGDHREEFSSDKRAWDFVGKRAREFIGKRQTEFDGKRAREFIGKRAREFIGKRAREFIGKRAREFIGKRAREFIGKRAREFIGKRAREFIGKRAREFIGKRAREFIGKRAREFIGKRAREFIGKRAREFIGKRSGQYNKRPREFIGKRSEYKYDNNIISGNDQGSQDTDPFFFLRPEVTKPYNDNSLDFIPSSETGSVDYTSKPSYPDTDDGHDFVSPVKRPREFIGKRSFLEKRPREFIGKRDDREGHFGHFVGDNSLSESMGIK